MTLEQAYEAGKRAAEKQATAVVANPIEAPQYDRIHAARFAETLTTAFWQGVRHYREQQSLKMPHGK